MAGGEKKKKKRSARSRSPSPRRRERSRSRSRSPRRVKRDSSRESSVSSSSSLSDSERSREKSSKRSSSKKTKSTKKEKEYYKALETPEEKRARRLAKKETKERKRRKEMGWNDEYEGYTNTDNPFGDAHLRQTFVWHKKREKHGEMDFSEEEKRLADKKRQIDTGKQLERVRQRRSEREHEMMLREEEKERMQRDKESTYYSAWEKQEDKFHLHQATLRSKIRIEDGRAKPIDLLAQYISTEEEDLDIQMHEPYTILVGLTQADLSDLLEDIKVYMELEQVKNTEYWQDVTLICKNELQKLRKQLSSHVDHVDRRDGIHTSVHSDVASIFKGKTYKQLIALEKQIYSKISSDDALDIGYWESLLQQLKVHMAKARLRERHQQMLREKLMQLREEKSGLAGSSGEIELSESEPESEKEEEPAKTPEEDENEPSTSKNTSWRDEPEEEEEDPENTEDATAAETSLPLFTEQDLVAESSAAYETGNYSPKLIKIGDVEEQLIMDPDDDWERLLTFRQEIMIGGTSVLSAQVKTFNTSAMVDEEARKGMAPDEETFNVPVPLSQKTYVWEDKYRPRKPRFFNRVHTGYEWNKYNQTHYDSDNPPPKIVQGYKFNIFYPDLIEKTVAPEYHLESAADEFAILRFHAGPPYEDIAFKIVNREWEYSHRKGFRCQFHNNIFQLWFHFKRYRYRR